LRPSDSRYPAFVVTTPLDHDDGFCDADCTLREAMTFANAEGSGNGQISFAEVFSTPQVIKLSGPLPDITASLFIYGSGANVIDVHRDSGGDYRIFNIPGNDLYIDIENITISNGSVPSGEGGAIFSNSLVWLANLVIRDSHSARGGAVAVNNSGFITQSAFHGNASDFGGAISYQGQPGSILTLDNVTLSGNQSDNGNGVWVNNSDYEGSIELQV
jgi:CSLREA domain-containing protein